jgi:hypothetical protein
LKIEATPITLFGDLLPGIRKQLSTKNRQIFDRLWEKKKMDRALEMERTIILLRHAAESAESELLERYGPSLYDGCEAGELASEDPCKPVCWPSAE